MKLDVRGRLRRIGSRAWQRIVFGDRFETRPLFVVGCQRSGTSMLLRTIGRSRLVWPIDEGEDNPAFLDYRLRDVTAIQGLLDESPSPVMAFKPVCDSQLVDRLLEDFERGQAIWIYRDYRDVINSAQRRFDDHQRELVRSVVGGEPADEPEPWVSERLGEDTLDWLHEMVDADLSSEEGSALFWCLRNRLYFDLGLYERDDVMLVRYESIVDSPAEEFRRIFRFIDLPFTTAILDRVHGQSVGKESAPKLRPRYVEACEGLLTRLHDAVPDRGAIH